MCCTGSRARTTFWVAGVLPDEGFGVMYGQPGSRKTFMGLDVAFAIAGAADAQRDKYVEQGAVIFFGMEGGPMFGNRIHANMMVEAFANIDHEETDPIFSIATQVA